MKNSRAVQKAGLGLAAGLALALTGCNQTMPTGANSQVSGQIKASVAAVATSTPVTNLPNEPRWGVQVKSVNNVPDTASSVFQETFVVTNNDVAPFSRDLSEIMVRVYFGEPQNSSNPVVPVNSTFATVFDVNGNVTGVNSTVTMSQFGRFGQCTNPQGIVTTSEWDFEFQPGTIVPSGGFVAFTPELWRGGAFPFNDSHNFTSQNGNTVLHEDPNVSLIFNGLGDSTVACNFLNPIITEPENDPCTGVPFVNCTTQFP